MSGDVIISAKGVGKRYRIGTRAQYRTFREDLVGLVKDPIRRLVKGHWRNSGTSDHVWALQDVTFDILRGDVVGIIGRNGAGKSTLLKVLSRITAVTDGEIRMRGRVGSLLEVGSGFHPELTGRENIFLNGSILGMRRSEIQRRFDAIVDFAEIARFLDTPVKHYSSGMYMRLAFSVAAHLEPEILLIDEVLAVGDAEFQRKCLGKMGEVARQGRTVLFVSHNMGAIGALTTKCILMKSGRLDSFLPSAEAIASYFRQCEETRTQQRAGVEAFRRDRIKDPHLQVSSIAIEGTQQTLPSLNILADLSVVLDVVVHSPVAGASVTLRIKNSDGVIVATVFSWDYGYSLTCPPGLARITVRVPSAPFAPGRYLCDVGINQSPSSNSYDAILDYPLFETTNNSGTVPLWPERIWGTTYLPNVIWGCDHIANGETGANQALAAGQFPPVPRT